jgi:apolipoprotein N-acyltransferase
MPNHAVTQHNIPERRTRPFSHLRRDGLALLAGFLFTLAFAPFNIAVLAPIALVVLFASWQHASVARAALRGYLFGLGSFGAGVSWVFVSIHDFGHASTPAAGALTALFVVFWALFPALAGGLAVRCHARKNIILAPLIWVLIEYFRGALLLNGFPWLLGAYSQLNTPLAGYVPLIGAYGTGFLLALSASIGVAILQHKEQRLWLCVLLATIWLIGNDLQTVKWTTANGQPFSVALIQGNISQDQKWLPENRLSTLLMYKKLTEEHWGTDVIIWPETAIPAYLSEVEGFFLAPLKAQALAHHTDLVVSLPVEGQGENELYNSVVTLGKDNGLYSKNHLLPFGEYMPWQPLSGYILHQLDIRLGDFTAGGDSQPLLRAGGHAFITSICYEDAFGDANIVGLADAAYLVNVTNDGWFGDSLEPHQHLQMARMRALETGRFLLRATNTGLTAVIAPDGSLLKQAPPFTTAVLTASITPMSGMTPYAHVGDGPIIGVLLVIFLGVLGKRAANVKNASAGN